VFGKPFLVELGEVSPNIFFVLLRNLLGFTNITVLDKSFDQKGKRLAVLL